MSQSGTPDDLLPYIFMFKKEARKCHRVRRLMICFPYHSFLNYGNLFHCKWDVNSFSCCLRTDIAVASCLWRANISLFWTKTSQFCSKFGNKINDPIYMQILLRVESLNVFNIILISFFHHTKHLSSWQTIHQNLILNHILQYWWSYTYGLSKHIQYFFQTLRAKIKFYYFYTIVLKWRLLEYM